MLLKSAVTGEKLPLPDGFTLESAADIIQKQHLLPLTYQGALNCGLSQDTPMMQQLLRVFYRHMIRSERQMRSVQRIFDAFEENAIHYMPVKGCNMKCLYPKSELRSMGDADILIRLEQYDRIRPIMQSLGFAEELETDHVYLWHNDALHVELHKCLAPPEDTDYHAYYGTGWRLAAQQTGFRHDPTPEDTFLFLFVHFARHYRYSGIGLRHVMDLYVYRRAFPALDQSYLCAELTKLRLLTFYHNTCRLLDTWFDGAAGDAVTEHMAQFIFSGGSWGSMEHFALSKEARYASRTGAVHHAKPKMLLRSIFPPYRTMCGRYAVLDRCPVLLPAMWVVRWAQALVLRPENIGRAAQRAHVVSNETVDAHWQSLRYVGLDFDDQAAAEQGRTDESNAKIT